ncbi:MAG: DUF3566 domain-containing protein [Actinomycetota bacterium]|nr:DUF3566 domain-containing protein [Actinomycetota bacterium]
MTGTDDWGTTRRSAESTAAVDLGSSRRATSATAGTAVGSRPGTTSPPPATRGPRRAKLAVRRVDPWSVMKFSAVLSVVLAVVLVVAAALLYLLLAQMGVFDSVNTTVHSFTGASGSAPHSIFTAKNVIGVAAVIGLIDIVLFTALATLGAFAYNLCADLVGGIEVTLAEHE